MRLSDGVSPPVHRAHLVGGDVELVAAPVLEQQVVAFDAPDGALGHPRVAADAVLVVHDEVAGLERVVEVCAATRAPRPAVHTPPAGEVGLGDHGHLRPRDDDAALEGRDNNADLARRDAVDRVDAFTGEHIAEATRRSLAVGGDRDTRPVVAQCPQPPGQPLGVADDRVEARGGQVRRAG